MKKIILIGLLMMLLISFAVADYYDNLLLTGNTHYYTEDIDGSCLDSASSMNGTLRASTDHEDNCIIGGCYNLSLSGSLNDGIMFENASEGLYALSFWFQGSISTALRGTSIGLRNWSAFGGGTMYLAHGELSAGATDETLMFHNELDGVEGIYIKDVAPFGWHHVVMNWNSTNYEIWLDGTPRVTYADIWGSLSFLTWYQLRIGTDGATADFEGAFDEVSIWNRSLTDEEIVYLYNQGSGHQYPYSLLVYPIHKGIYYGTYNESVIVETVTAQSKCYLDQAYWILQGSQDTNLFHWLNPSFTLGNLSMQYSCAPKADYTPGYIRDIVSNNTGTLSGYTLNHASNHSTHYNATGGYFGGAYEFDGDDSSASRLLLGSKSIMNGNITKYSFSMWTYAVAVDAQSYPFISGNTWDNDFFTVLTSGANVGFYMRESGTYCSVLPGTMPINKWTHFAGTFDNGDLRMYKNGTLWDNKTCVITWFTEDDNEFMIGTRSPAGSYGWNGTLDEMRFWNNTVLTQPEIQAEMNSANPVHTEGLVASYSFSEYAMNTTHTFDTNPSVQGHNEDNHSQAMRFDGVDDYVDSNYVLQTNTPFTVSYWINPIKIGTDWAIGSFDAGGDYFLTGTRGANQFSVRIDGTNNDIIGFTYNTWTHILVSSNGTRANVYFNSINVSTVDYTAVAKTQELTIGGWNNVGTHTSATKGSIDDVMIWDRALSQDEITALYNNNSWKYNPYDPLADGMISYYDFQANDVIGDWYVSDFWTFIGSLFRINIFDEQSNDMINDTISFIFRSSSYEFKASAINGSYDLFNISEIPPGFYQIILNGSEYYPRVYHLTIENISFQTTNFYLLKTNVSSLVVFKVKDMSDKLLDNISLIFTTWINITSSDAPITHRYTDFAGSTLVNLHYLTRYGITITDPSRKHSPKYTELEPIFSSYTIYLSDNTSQNFTTVWDHVSYDITVKDMTLNPVLKNFSFITASDNGNIDFYGIYATINGTYYVTNITTHPSGGTATLLLPLNESNNKNIDVYYFIKTSNPHYGLFPFTYSVLNISSWVGNYSLAQTAPTYRNQFSERLRLLSAHFIAIICIAIFAVFIRRNYAPLIGIPVLIIFAIPLISWIPAWIVVFETIINIGFFTAFGDW